MVAKSRGFWAALIVVGLVVGAIGGYFGRAGEVAALQRDVASVQESKSMLQAELDQAQANLTKVLESKAMLEEELKVATVPIAFTSESGQMIHDVWLLVAPVGQGKVGVVIRAEGLEATSGEGIYLVEGVERAEPMRTVPLGSTLEASEFVADSRGQGLYWVVLNGDPRMTFDKVMILYLPGMSMERAVLLATVNLG